MSCENCNNFSEKIHNFERIGYCNERISKLFKCKFCGQFIELPELGKNIHILLDDELKEPCIKEVIKKYEEKIKRNPHPYLP